ncbi:MAG: EAL domain-containing protein [Oscillospiraceae bacterium]|nr:EAL domain-containing protein [Oscillospiraceae bacterium]
MSLQTSNCNPDEARLEQMKRLGEQIPGGFFAYRADEAQELLYVNQAVLDIFGCDTLEEFRELTGFTFRGLVHPDDLEAVQTSIDRQIADSANNNLDYVEYRIIRKDGEIRRVDDYGRLAQLSGGGVYYVFITDITDKRRAQEDRFRAELELEREKKANDIRSELLLGLSNDIRAPLGELAGFADRTRSHIDDPEKLKIDLESVDAASRQLRHMADALYEMSSAEFGRIEIQREPCDLLQLLQDAAEPCLAEAERKGVDLVIDADIPEDEVLADAKRLKGVLVNLIDNAISYTPTGGEVTLGARCTRVPGRSYAKYELTVSDSGAGMNDEVLRRSERILRSEDSVGSDEVLHDLSVDKKMLSMMGGAMTVRSTEGMGTSFTVSIPLQLAAHNRSEQFDSAFEMLSALACESPVYLYDLRTQSARFSSSLIELVGAPEDGLSAEDGLYFWSEHIHPDERERFMNLLLDVTQLKRMSFDMRCRMRIKNGAYYNVRFIGSVMKDAEGFPDFFGLTVKSEDLSELSDPVTALPNRHRLMLELQNIESGARAVLMLRLGMIDSIRRAYGCVCAGKVLKGAAELIQNAVGGKGTVYHTDEAEFVILSSELGEEELSEVYDWLRVALHERVETDGLIHRLNVSGSLLLLSSERRLNESEIVGYLSTGCGESERKLHGAVVTIAEDDEFSVETPAVTREIRRCLDNDFENFFLLYQPVFAPGGDMRPIGVEALLRWKNEQYGEIKPGRFLEDIERESSFRELGYWILERAMTDGVTLLRADPDFTVCVNISQEHAADPYFAERVATIANETGFPPDRLHVELSRECHSLPPDDLRMLAAPLRELGVKIGIDDFGSGSAWLDALFALRGDYVKFGSDFTNAILRSEEDRDAVHRLSELAHAYHADVYFKAVESEETANALAGLTVQGAQGWFFSEALYFDEILEWLGAPGE